MSYLKIRAHDGSEFQVPIRQNSAIVGRSPRNSDIVIADPRVSRVHMQINRALDGTLTLVDLQSAHGTHLNGNRLKPHIPYPWQPNEEVHIGSTSLSLVSNASAPLPATASVEETQPAESVTVLPSGGEHAHFEATQMFPETMPLPEGQFRPRVYVAVTPLRLSFYLILLVGMELTHIFLQPAAGMLANIALLILFWLHSGRTRYSYERQTLLSLSLVPLLRLMSVTLPLASLPLATWSLVIALPLLAAIWVTVDVSRLKWRDIGVHYYGLFTQGIIGLTGLLLGIAAYAVVPSALADARTGLADLAVAAGITFLFGGVLDELIFRGLIQRSVAIQMGERRAILYAALIYSSLFLGNHNLVFVGFVALVSVAAGWISSRTQSVIGVALAHGLLNVVALVVLPALARPTTG